MSTELFVKIDSHAHLASDELFDDVDGIIERAKSAGLSKVINICTDLVTLERGLALKKRYPDFIYNTGATTPHDVEKEGEAYFGAFETAAENGDLVAIGETGLDYHYEHSDRKCQQQFLKRYFELAKRFELPVVIHCRGDEAFADLFAIAREMPDVPRCVLHCFTGNEAQANIALQLGWYISISGIATFKKSTDLRKTIKGIPIEKMFIETDSPYLAPQSKRGKRNEPTFVGEVAQTIALEKDITEKEVCEVTTKNSCAFFQV